MIWDYSSCTILLIPGVKDDHDLCSSIKISKPFLRISLTQVSTTIIFTSLTPSHFDTEIISWVDRSPIYMIKTKTVVGNHII